MIVSVDWEEETHAVQIVKQAVTGTSTDPLLFTCVRSRSKSRGNQSCILNKMIGHESLRKGSLALVSLMKPERKLYRRTLVVTGAAYGRLWC